MTVAPASAEGPGTASTGATSRFDGRLHKETVGSGDKLLLIHGVGSSARLWRRLAPELARTREVIAIDLPGHGRSPADAEARAFDGLVRSIESWLAEEGLHRVDMVGNSLGGRVVLELARRGSACAVVALDPGGFWLGFERTYLQTTLLGSVFMLRTMQGLLPALAENAAARSMLLAPLSAQPWAVDGAEALAELDSYVSTAVFAELVNEQAAAPMQGGPAASAQMPLAIGWGRHDRLCLPVQALRAQAAFPSARLHWFEHSGHMPMWDEPEETLKLIRETIDRRPA